MDYAPSMMAGDMSSCYVRFLCGPLSPRFECWKLNTPTAAGVLPATLRLCRNVILRPFGMLRITPPKNLVFVTP